MYLILFTLLFCWITRPLKDSYELEGYLESLYADAAQYNQPPKYPVNMLCGGIDGAALGTDNDILSKIFAGVVASKVNKTCYVNPPINESETTVGYRWQVIYIKKTSQYSYILLI